MKNLVLQFKIPNYIVYDNYASNGTRSPDGVTESQEGNFRLVALQFNELLTSENVSVQIAVHVHEDDGFADDSFHHAPCVVSLRHQIENPCGSGSLPGQTEAVMTQIPFYSPDCDGFGPLGLSSGGTKDSQITASSTQIRSFLPYSAKLGANFSGWSPLRASGGELHAVHFIQVDLREAIQTKFMFAVEGLSPKIPKDKIFLVLSEDGLKWKEKKFGIDTAVDRSARSTVIIMKSLKFTATARFVRVVLPPFQKPGGEQPVYKVELYGCPADRITKGKPKLVPVPVAVGMESGVIADNQLTSSSEKGVEYGAQYSRLNSRSGGGAWCAVSCDSSEYLQIDLGQVYLIFELKVQSKHDESENTNSVLSFYFEFSADGASWEYYKANAASKLFVGSPLRNLAVRHKLLFPVHAQFVRFRPQTDACTNMACMRVELFWYPDSDAQSPVVFGRSFLLEESTNTISESPCKGSTDGGETWNDLQQNVLNVLVYDPVNKIYYGISNNKITYLRSGFSPFMVWKAIANRIWEKAKETSSLITATEVPFIPVMPGSLDEPFDALTVPSSSVSLKRRRRSVASVDMWGSSSKGVLFKPSGAIDWKMVYSWIDYPYDTKVDCLAIPCNNGTCAKTPDGGYKCNCFPGFNGSHCSQEIDECASNPCTGGAPCVDKVNGFTCICPIGYTGVQCDINIDDCAGSPCVNGDCIDGLNQYMCSCHPGNTGLHCEIDIDECASSPCLNGGTCLNEVNQFSCNCPPGFTGVQCETDIDDCANNPCVNGDCFDGVNQYACNCYPGNTGVNCEIDIDECASSPCVNGDCVDGVNQYTCSCHPGYTGVHCETDIDECASNPCSNGGVCVNEVNQFSCNCIPGFTGVQCETNIDECASNPCVNGVCVDGVNQYACNCNAGSTGTQCEFDLSCVASNPCLNGGTCVPSVGGGYTCDCTFFRSGPHCELGAVSCLRLPTWALQTSWPNSGKFDKIAFSINADHFLLGISIGSTIQQGILVQLTIKLTDISGGVIASKTIPHTFNQGIEDLPVYFDQPILLTADQQYIAASQVEGAGNPETIKSFEGSAVLSCNPQLTITFSDVPADEMADSNGSTVQEGQISVLYFKPS
ncbi:uncharacterized protein LOC144645865 [Oculina patagonica]